MKYEEEIQKLANIKPHEIYGMSCILYTQIPDDIKPIFDKWIAGQTVMSNDTGEMAIYIWDWENFLNYLQDKPTFWD